MIPSACAPVQAALGLLDIMCTPIYRLSGCGPKRRYSMPQTLVLCDIDKTLITVDGQPIASNTRPVARTLQERGTVIGLCSDSSVITMQKWATYFGLAGPLIAERGAILLDHPGAEAIFLGEWPRYFADLRDMVFQRLSGNSAFRVAMGERGVIFGGLCASASIGSRHIVINTTRQASLSMYARRVASPGKLAFDLDLLGELEERVRGAIKMLTPDFPFYWDRNLDYSILIIGAAEATKQLGVRQLLERRPFDRVIVIGDSKWDFVDDPRVEQWAVANANPEYRDRCSLVATAEFTPGVEELLRMLL